MGHDFESRQWAEHRTDFAAFLVEAAGTIHSTFERLTAHLYDAPWERSVSARRQGCETGHR